MTVVGNEPEGISVWDKHTGRDDPSSCWLAESKLETRERADHQKSQTFNKQGQGQ